MSPNPRITPDDQERIDELTHFFHNKRELLIDVAAFMGVNTPGKLDKMNMEDIIDDMVVMEVSLPESPEDIAARLEQKESRGEENMTQPQGIQEMYHCPDCQGFFPDQIRHLQDKHPDQLRDLQQQLQAAQAQGAPPMTNSPDPNQQPQVVVMQDPNVSQQLTALQNRLEAQEAELARLRAQQVQPPPQAAPAPKPTHKAEQPEDSILQGIRNALGFGSKGSKPKH